MSRTTQGERLLEMHSLRCCIETAKRGDVCRCGRSEANVINVALRNRGKDRWQSSREKANAGEAPSGRRSGAAIRRHRATTRGAVAIAGTRTDAAEQNVVKPRASCTFSSR